jgi:hypothetical protein
VSLHLGVHARGISSYSNARRCPFAACVPLTVRDLFWLSLLYMKRNVRPRHCNRYTTIQYSVRLLIYFPYMMAAATSRLPTHGSNQEYHCNKHKTPRYYQLEWKHLTMPVEDVKTAITSGLQYDLYGVVAHEHILSLKMQCFSHTTVSVGTNAQRHTSNVHSVFSWMLE